jgi:hypothetical protein
MAPLPILPRIRPVRRAVVSAKGIVQTYRLTLTMECGHELRRTVSAEKYHAGDRGPKRTECYECTNAEIRRQEKAAQKGK